MKVLKCPWLAGFALARSEHTGRLVRVGMTVYLRSVARHFASVRLMDREGLEFVNMDGQPIFRFMATLSASKKVRLPEGPGFRRPRELFGDEGFRGLNIELSIPEVPFRKSTSIGLDLGGRCCQTEAHGQTRFCGDSVHLDMNSQLLSHSEGEVLFLLMTRSEGGKRVVLIAQSRDYFEKVDEQTAALISNLACEAFQGADSPLLTTDLS